MQVCPPPKKKKKKKKKKKSKRENYLLSITWNFLNDEVGKQFPHTHTHTQKKNIANKTFVNV